MILREETARRKREQVSQKPYYWGEKGQGVGNKTERRKPRYREIKVRKGKMDGATWDLQESISET